MVATANPPDRSDTEGAAASAMKVGFEFDIDDLIDVHRRMTSASPTFKAIHRSTLASTGVFIAVLTYLLTSGSVQERLIYAAAGAAAWCAVYPFIRRATLKSRLRSYWKEHLEGEGPFTLEVELSDQGVLLQQFRTETLNPWSMVKSVEEKDGAVEIAVRQGVFIVVRDRAFATADEKRRFIELGQSYMRRLPIPAGP